MASTHTEFNDLQRECGICYDKLENDNIMMLPCCHSLCHDCFGKLVSKNCPFCRYDFTSDYNEFSKYSYCRTEHNDHFEVFDTMLNSFDDFDDLDETITRHMRKLNKRKKKHTSKYDRQNLTPSNSSNHSHQNSSMISNTRNNTQINDLFDYHVIFNISDNDDDLTNTQPSNHSSHFYNNFSDSHSQHNHLNFYKKRHIVYKNPRHNRPCNKHNFHRTRN